MNAAIRAAAPTDASALAAIAFEAFGETLDPERLAQRLGTGANLVALRDGAVVGFAGGFLTRSSKDELRFELDLLAVSGAARGHGLGKLLIEACLDLARCANVDRLRALVALDNLAMQSLCAACGLQRNDMPHTIMAVDAKNLLLSDRDSVSRIDPPESTNHLVPVETLTYSGIWLEGQITRRALDRARRIAILEGRERIGAVVAHNDARAKALLLSEGFASAGDYHWWTLKPGNG